MENRILNIRDLVANFVKIKDESKKLDVIRSERFIGEFGEWFAEEFTGAKRAKSTSQSGWDLIDRNGIKFQVKTHAKGENNTARWTNWSYDNKVFDFLIILIFTNKLELKEIYKVPFEATKTRVNLNLKQKVLKWDDFSDYKISFDDISEDLKVFLKN